MRVGKAPGELALKKCPFYLHYCLGVCFIPGEMNSWDCHGRGNHAGNSLLGLQQLAEEAGVNKHPSKGAGILWDVSGGWNPLGCVRKICKDMAETSERMIPIPLLTKKKSTSRQLFSNLFEPEVVLVAVF